jgi:MFS family permease
MQLHIPPALYHASFACCGSGWRSPSPVPKCRCGHFWHIRTLTDQPIALGAIGLARIVPVIVFSLVGGAVADTLNRRLVLFITQSAMALTALALAWLTFQDRIDLWHIYALTAIQAVAIAFDLPARQALVPNLVPGRDLPNAFSLQAIAFQTGSILGPAMSGLVIAYGGNPTYLINAISFLAVIAALIAIGPVPQQVQAGERAEVSASIVEGTLHLGTTDHLLSMLLDFSPRSSPSEHADADFRPRYPQGRDRIRMAFSAQSIARDRRPGHFANRWFAGKGLSSWLRLSRWPARSPSGCRAPLVAMLALVLIGASGSVSTIIRNTIRQLRRPNHPWAHDQH